MLIKACYYFKKLLGPIKTSKASSPLIIAKICPTILFVSAFNMYYSLYKMTMQFNVVVVMEAP